jgi:hypothetical protein
MNVTCRQIGTGIVAAEQNAEKARKSLMEANVPTDIMGRLGVRRRALIVRASPLRDA